MKILVLGFGSMGRRHYKNAMALKRHEVRVFDPAVKPSMDDAETFFGSDRTAYEWAEAVIIATPAHTHLGHILAAHGKPVFVEKPALTSLDIAPLTLAEANVTVGYNMRYLRAIRRIKETIRRVGTPRSALLNLFCDRKTWPGKDYADTLAECSHEIDLALHLLGPAELTHAISAHDGHDWLLALRHESGCRTVLAIDDGFIAYSRGGRIVFERDTLTWDWKGHSPTGEFIWQTLTSDMYFNWQCPVEQSYRDELHAWLNAIEAGGLPPDPACTFAEGLAVVKIIEQARALAATPAHS